MTNIFKDPPIKNINLPRKKKYIEKTDVTTFKIKDKNNLFDFKQMDFPELVKQPTYQNNNTIELNFKDASLKQIDNNDSNDSNYIPNGWTTYRMVDRNIIKNGNINLNNNFHNDAYKAFNIITHKWENYKNNYNELHGLDEYERLYNTINILENIDIYDDIQEEEEEDENYINDEDDDYN